MEYYTNSVLGKDDTHYDMMGGKRLSGRLGRPKVVSVQFIDKKTGKVRHFQAKVKKPKYLNTTEMVKGMAENGMSEGMITQAVMKREKVDKRTAAKMIKNINPKYVAKKKKSSPSKSKSASSKSKSASSKSKSKSASSKSKSKSASSKSKSKSKSASSKSRKRPNTRPSRRRGGLRTQRQYSLW